MKTCPHLAVIRFWRWRRFLIHGRIWNPCRRTVQYSGAVGVSSESEVRNPKYNYYSTANIDTCLLLPTISIHIIIVDSSTYTNVLEQEKSTPLAPHRLMQCLFDVLLLATASLAPPFSSLKVGVEGRFHSLQILDGHIGHQCQKSKPKHHRH